MIRQRQAQRRKAQGPSLAGSAGAPGDGQADLKRCHSSS